MKKNEIQQNIQMGNFVRFGLFVSVLVGLCFLIWGVRLLTNDLPPLPPDPFAPHLNPPAEVHLQKSHGAESAPKKPQKIRIEIEGESVEGTIQ